MDKKYNKLNDSQIINLNQKKNSEFIESHELKDKHINDVISNSEEPSRDAKVIADNPTLKKARYNYREIVKREYSEQQYAFQ